MVPCSGDLWVASSPAGFFTEEQLKFSPVTVKIVEFQVHLGQEKTLI